MHLKRPYQALCAGVILLFCGSAAKAQSAEGAGGKIQFAPPSNPAIASNLNRLNPDQGALKRVEDDLFRPFKDAVPKNSLDGVMSLPQPQAPMMAPDRRTQEMIEKRKNWAFTDWSDLFPNENGDDMTDTQGPGSDSRQRGQMSLIERYYEGLEGKATGKTNGLNLSAVFSRSIGSTNIFDPTASSYTAEDQIRRLLKDAIAPRTGDVGGADVVDFSKLTYHQPTPEQMQEQKLRYEEFQRILDPKAAALEAAHPVEGVAAGVGALSPVTGLNGLGETLNGQHRSMTTIGGVTDPTAKAFYSHAYDDPTAVALGQTNNVLTPLENPPPAPSTPATLQPFDNLPKRKF